MCILVYDILSMLMIMIERCIPNRIFSNPPIENKDIISVDSVLWLEFSLCKYLIVTVKETTVGVPFQYAPFLDCDSAHRFAELYQSVFYFVL